MDGVEAALVAWAEWELLFLSCPMTVPAILPPFSCQLPSRESYKQGIVGD